MVEERYDIYVLTWSEISRRFHPYGYIFLDVSKVVSEWFLEYSHENRFRISILKSGAPSNGERVALTQSLDDIITNTCWPDD